MVSRMQGIENLSASFRDFIDTRYEPPYTPEEILRLYLRHFALPDLPRVLR